MFSKGFSVIDVRDPDEYRDGHIEAATNISRGFLEFRVGTDDKPLDLQREPKAD
mgnify:CR=1 FL=1